MLSFIIGSKIVYSNFVLFGLKIMLPLYGDLISKNIISLNIFGPGNQKWWYDDDDMMIWYDMIWWYDVARSGRCAYMLGLSVKFCYMAEGTLFFSFSFHPTFLSSSSSVSKSSSCSSYFSCSSSFSSASCSCSFSSSYSSFYNLSVCGIPFLIAERKRTNSVCGTLIWILSVLLSFPLPKLVVSLSSLGFPIN